MKHTQLAHLVPEVVDLTRTPFDPSTPLPMHAVPPYRPLKTFADVDVFILQHPDWPKGRGPLRSTCHGVACRVNAILASKRNEPFESDPKKLDLATVPFDIPMINGAWNGRSYREAGFACKKSFRNARWAIRRIAARGRNGGPTPCPADPARRSI